MSNPRNDFDRSLTLCWNANMGMLAFLYNAYSSAATVRCAFYIHNPLDGRTTLCTDSASVAAPSTPALAVCTTGCSLCTDSPAVAAPPTLLQPLR